MRPDELDMRRRLGEIIRARSDHIEQLWLDSVLANVVREQRSLSQTELRNGIPDYIEGLASHLAQGDNGTAAHARTDWLKIAREHGLTRVRIGFDVSQLIREFIILRKILYQVVDESGLSLEANPGLLGEYVVEAIAAAVQSYVEARDYQARQAQAETVGLLTHDLRTPLTAASLATSRLRDAKGHDAAELIGRIERSHDRLVELVESVLLTQQLEAGKVELRPRRLRLGEVMKDIVEVARIAAEAKGLVLEASYDPAIPISGEPSLLRSAIENVINNAVEYTDDGEVQVVIEAQRGNVVVHVRDTCGGLSPQELRTIFEPFRRGSRRDRHSGTGLGLAVARRAVEAHGGRIDAESLGERGCHFWITLPQEATEQPDTSQVQA